MATLDKGMKKRLYVPQSLSSGFYKTSDKALIA
jgi:hypothetical protein